MKDKNTIIMIGIKKYVYKFIYYNISSWVLSKKILELYLSIHCITFNNVYYEKKYFVKNYTYLF